MNNSLFLYTGLIIFCSFQLRLLYNEHIALLSYTADMPGYRSYQIHTYGTVVVYLSILVWSVYELYGIFSVGFSFPEWSPPKSLNVGGGGGLASTKRELSRRFRELRRRKNI